MLLQHKLLFLLWQQLPVYRIMYCFKVMYDGFRSPVAIVLFACDYSQCKASHGYIMQVGVGRQDSLNAVQGGEIRWMILGCYYEH